MNKTPTIILSLLLTAFILACIYLFLQVAEKESILSKQSEKIDDLNARTAILDENLEKLGNRIRDKTEIIASLNNEVDRITELEQEIHNKDKALADVQNINNELTSTSDRLKQTLQERDQQLALLRGTANKLENRLRESDKILQKTEMSLKATEIRLAAACDQNMASLKSRIEDHSQKSSETMSQNQNLKHAYDILNAEMESTTDKLAHEQEVNDKLHAKNNMLNSDINKTKKELKRLKKQLTSLLKERDIDQKREVRIREAYEKMLSELHDEIENKETVIRQVQEKLVITFIDKVLFETGQASITPIGEQKLKTVANILSDIKDGKIHVSGHTDNVPIAPYNRYKYPSNWELSTARAAAVVRFLIDQGDLIPENLQAVGHSFFKSVANNDTPENRAQNRRVEIVIVP